MGDREEVDIPTFLAFTREHHLVLFPAFQLQMAMQRKILGIRFWERCSDRRIRVNKHKFVTVSELVHLVSR